MKKINKRGGLIALLLLVVFTLWGESCEPNYTCPYFAFTDGACQGNTASTHYNTRLTVGQPLINIATNYSSFSTVTGFWSFYLKEPRPPIVKASDGDFADMVLVEWTIEDDRTGPPVTGDEVQLLRNGYPYTTLPISQTAYQDLSVFPGEYYVYGVVSSNDMGTSHTDDNIGFLNPNGVITGHIETPSGNPVQDAKVTLTPNMGRSAEFAPGEEAYIYYIDPETSVNRLFSGLEEDYTIETWFRSIHTDQVQTLFSAVDSLTTEHYLKLEIIEGGYLRWQHNPVAGISGTELVTVNPYSGFDEEGNANWHHVSCVFNALEMTMYVDGFIVGESTASDYIADQTEIIIGKSAPAENCNYFYGRMDDFRIWSIAREWEELRKYRDITLSGNEAGLAAYWKFDEVEGDIIFDLTANDNDGEICHMERSSSLAPVYVGAVTDSEGNYAIRGIYFGNGTTFTVSPSQQTNIGRALELNGVDQHISFNGVRTDLTYDFTIEGWFKTAEARSQSIFSAFDPATNEEILQIGITENGFINCSRFDTELSGNANVTDNLWHHYAVSYSAETDVVCLYLDGELIDSETDASAVSTLSSILMGRSAGDEQYFEGRIDEVRLWSVCRNYDQINGTIMQPLEGSEYGLANYWKMNEGTDLLLTDATGNLATGTLENGVVWTEDIPLHEIFDHYYEPESRQASLNHSNTAVDLINFTDVSMIPVSGYIRYESSACFLEDAQILVNGQSLIPPVYTDADGKWTIELEPGSVGDLVSPSYADHQFTPPSIELPMISSPITGLYFSDQELREVSGIVAGGSCRYPITPSQGEIEVTVRAVNGCIEKTVIPDPITGNYEIGDLPPMIYQIWLEHPNPNIDGFFAADTLSLEEEDREYDFIYYAPPEVIINDIPPAGDITLPDQSVISDAGLMAQNESYDIEIEIREAYTTWLNGENIINYCSVDSGEVNIIDHINYDIDTTYTFFDGAVGYSVTAKLPNILGGGEHPYQKELTVIATDQYDRQASATEWIFVTGNRPRNTTFTTTTPEIPLMILRDPPGDGSSSYLSNTDEQSMSVGFSTIFSSNTSVFAALHLGVDVTISAGQFIFTDFMVDTTMDLTATASVGITNTDAYEQTWTLSTTETISTSNNDDFVGEEGDIYMGGAMNLLYGITDILNIEAGELVLSEDMIIAPSGFATNYLYSEYHIQNTLIPSLYDIGDIASAQLWQSYVDMNHSLKDSATLLANRSFDAGAIYEYSETSQTIESFDIGFELEIETEIATEIGALINGVGFSGGVMINTQMTVGSSYNNTSTHTNTVGYTLTDNDMGDFFTVDVKWDNVYGTPVFDLVSGSSSCPWEEETLRRSLPSLTISPSSQINVPPNEPAIFTMQLGNLSESEEDREYLFSIVNSSNPNGAQISVNGIYIEDYLSYIVPYGQVTENVLSIERGPEVYLYEDLQFEFYPPGDEELGATATVSVEFQQAASEVHIAVPENNWLVNSVHGSDTLWVTIDGYNRLAENLESIDLQYRQVTSSREEGYDEEIILSICNGSAGENSRPAKTDAAVKERDTKNRERQWFTAYSVLKENLIEDYILMPWNISPEIVADGNYELRAVTVSTGDTGNGYSNIVPGMIDRNGPQVFGNPEPVDGILDPDDNISISFNENINGELISAGNQDIALWNTTSGQMVDFNFTYGFNTITVEPGVNNAWIENQILRVDINALQDMHGNSIAETISWEFFVNRNPIEWMGQNISEVIYVDETVSSSRVLRNAGGSNRSFELIGGRDNGLPSGEPLPLPDWLEISPIAGMLAPGEEISVSLSLVDDVSLGEYTSTIYASGVLGDEPLLIDIRILEYPPDWSIDITDFEYSMNMTAVLAVDNILSEDVYDRIGVFVNDQCRGIGEISYIPSLQNELGLHPYEAFISIYSNVNDGEVLDFRVWDASEGALLANIIEEYVFEANSVLGNPTAPVSITATSQVIQHINVNDGWNWLSFNLENDEMMLNEFLGSLSPDLNDIIKSQSGFAQFVPGYGWIGNMTEIDNLSMYLLRIAENDTLEITGYPVNLETDTLFVSDGWNWISYLPQSSMELNYALNSLEGLTTGDIIKSQAGFAQFVENMGWFGNMQFMQPKKGYLLRLTYPGELVYPCENVLLASLADEEQLSLSSNICLRDDANAPDWQVFPEQYEHNMNLIAVVLTEGLENANDGDLLAAFSGDECRGVNGSIYLPAFDRHLFFLTIYGDQAIDNLQLRYYNSLDGNITNLNESIDFSANLVTGLVTDPCILNTCLVDEDDEYIPVLETKLRSLYPNPFNPELFISYSLAEAAKVEIVVYNIKGQKVKTLVDQQQESGIYQISWKGLAENSQPAASGVYFLSIKATDYQKMRKVLLMK